MTELRVLVARHGARPYVGSDPELHPHGHDQAQALAVCLHGLHPSLLAIYASPFIRTLQTAQPIAQVYGMPVRVEFGEKPCLVAMNEQHSCVPCVRGACGFTRIPACATGRSGLPPGFYSTTTTAP